MAASPAPPAPSYPAAATARPHPGPHRLAQIQLARKALLRSNPAVEQRVEYPLRGLERQLIVEKILEGALVGVFPAVDAEDATVRGIGTSGRWMAFTRERRGESFRSEPGEQEMHLVDAEHARCRPVRQLREIKDAADTAPAQDRPHRRVVVDEAIVKREDPRVGRQRRATIDGADQLVERNDVVFLLQPVELLFEQCGRQRADGREGRRLAVAYVVVHDRETAVLHYRVPASMATSESPASRRARSRR